MEPNRSIIDLRVNIYNPLISRKAARLALAIAISFFIYFLASAQAQTPNTPISIENNECSAHQIGPPSIIYARVPPQFGQSVRLQVTINTRGEVEAAHALQGSPAVFAEAETLEMKRHFKPFQRNNQAVRATCADFIPIYLPEEWASPRVPFPSIKNWNSLHIRLERKPCDEYCPVYSVEVHGNGDVFYQGTSGLMLIAGRHRERISLAAVSRLLSSFQEADFFSLKDKYEISPTVLLGSVISLEFDGRKKKVVDHQGYIVGLPKIVARLENLIEEAAQTDKWLQGNSDTAPSLLREHWNFKANTSDNDKLFLAAIGHPDILQLYLEQGFPPVRSRHPAESPLVSAALYGNPVLLQCLLRDRQRTPATILTEALATAAAMGDVPTMRFLMARGAKPDGPLSKKDDGTPPLISAVYSGKAAAVDELLKFHPNVNATDKDGQNAINILLTRILNQSENIQILRSLIRAGANVNVHDTQDGETPIFKASSVNNSVAILRLLVAAGADVNARDQYSRTPLMTCFDADYAKVLIELGADVSARDDQGQTAVQVAREMGDTELVAVLEQALESKQMQK